MPEGKENCLFCLKLAESNPKSVEEVNKLWGYLYHHNLQEFNAPGDGYSKNISDELSCPKLTFSLSVCNDKSVVVGEAGAESVKICKSCLGELTKLEKLHQEMEELRKRINSQVSRINRVCRSTLEEDYGLTGSALSSLYSSWKPPTMQLSFGGTTMGKENICKTLKFLGTFCDGMLQPELLPKSNKLTVPVSGDGKTTEDVHQPASSPMQMSSNQEDFAMYRENCTATTASDTLSTIIMKNVQTTGIYESETAVESEPMIKIDMDTAQVTNFSTPEIIPLPFSVDESSLFLDPDDTNSEILEQQNVSVQNVDARAQITLLPNTCPSQSSSLAYEPPKVNKKQCPTCGKWVASYYYSKHQKIHAGEKSHVCDICNKKFSQKGSYNIHRRNVHKVAAGRLPVSLEDRPVKCPFCSYRVNYKCSLRCHLRTQHKVSESEIRTLTLDKK